MINIPQIESDLKADEGFRDCVYQCSAGANTIGYGLTLIPIRCLSQWLVCSYGMV